MLTVFTGKLKVFVEKHPIITKTNSSFCQFNKYQSETFISTQTKKINVRHQEEEILSNYTTPKDQ
jgi:hypothetical protein